MKQNGQFLLFTREEFKDWLFKTTFTRKITLIQQHHTYQPDYADFKGSNHFDLLIGMKNYHVNTAKFSDIAQNITIFPDGLLAICRPFDVAPAGIKGANTEGLCIEDIGNFDTSKDKISDEHKKSIIYVNALLCKKFNLPVDTNNIVYHHWWDLSTGNRTNGTGTTKSCPGSAWYGGNTIENAQKNFIPLIKAEYDLLIKSSTSTTTPTIAKHLIMGKPVATKEQMVAFLLQKNKTPKINCSVNELVQYFIDEGLKEGVRGDVAFAQSLHETGNFNYGGIVKPEQNNFAGIGALNNNKEGQCAGFATPQLGVRAQIQHLKAYASKDALTQECVDPRFCLVTRAIAPNVEDLAGRWAYPGFDKTKYKTLDEALVKGETYGQMIMTIVDKMLAVKVDEPKTPVVETVDYKTKYEELKVANDNLVSENSKIKSKLNAIIGIING